MRVKLYKNEKARPAKLSYGLALCGGGIIGAMFELGVLAAVEDVLGQELQPRLDVVVGSSAGSNVAVPVALGVPVERMFQALYRPDDPFFPLERRHVMPVERKFYARAAKRMAIGLTRGFRRWARHRTSMSLADVLFEHAMEAAPIGLFRYDKFIAFYQDFLRRNGLPARFDELEGETLLIPANDTDSSERVVFGAGEHRNVDIAKAVAASSAIPMLFEPVRIGGREYFDGGIGRVGHLDLLADRGVNRVLVVSPVVPFRYDKARDRVPRGQAHLSQMGMFWLWNQSHRIMNKVKLHLGIEALVAQKPGLEVLLIEPGDEDTVMYLVDTMSLEKRELVMDHARSSTAAVLRKQWAEVNRFFGTQNLAIETG
jgi:NTE family protein